MLQMKMMTTVYDQLSAPRALDCTELIKGLTFTSEIMVLNRNEETIPMKFCNVLGVNFSIKNYKKSF